MRQVCALFNKSTTTNGVERDFVCPLCLKIAMEKGKRKVPETRPQAMLTAKDLPRCRLSDSLEERIRRAILKEKVVRADAAGVKVEDADEYPELFVRVVHNAEKKAEVKPRFAKQFCEGTGRVNAYPFKQKVIMLFQKINGVDTCLYCMYVHEYGENCPAPNNRVVYLSYLDSVKYFRPGKTGAAGMDLAMRTYVYQEVLMGYLENIKKRGFLAMYIWACPPGRLPREFISGLNSSLPLPPSLPPRLSDSLIILHSLQERTTATSSFVTPTSKRCPLRSNSGRGI